LGARRVGAVHAHGRRGLAGAGRAVVDLVQVDHRPAPVGAALLARLHAGLAADAPAVVDHEDGLVGHARGSSSWVDASPGSPEIPPSGGDCPEPAASAVLRAPVASGGSAEPRPSDGVVTDTSRSSVTGPPARTRSTRTAHTLYSGIFDSGSSTGLVSWLAALRPPQW